MNKIDVDHNCCHDWSLLSLHCCSTPMNGHFLAFTTISYEKGCIVTYAYLEFLWILHFWGRMHSHYAYLESLSESFTSEEGCIVTYAYLESLSESFTSEEGCIVTYAYLESLSESFTSEEGCIVTYAYLESLWILHFWGRMHSHLCLPGISLWILHFWGRMHSHLCLPGISLWILHFWGRMHSHLCLPGISLNPSLLRKDA